MTDAHPSPGVGPQPERRCATCGHPDYRHSHDDEACLKKHPQPCSLPGTLDAQRGAPLAPFRCQQCGCENFKELK